MSQQLFTYTLQTSQPFTQQQLDYINDLISNCTLPSNDSEFNDIPEDLFLLTPTF
jgi:hypothetical protein